MKTTTIRLDDDLLLLVQRRAKTSGRGIADVIRDAIRADLASYAAGDEDFRAYANEIAQRRLRASRQEIHETLYEGLLDEPAESIAADQMSP